MKGFKNNWYKITALFLTLILTLAACVQEKEEIEVVVYLDADGGHCETEEKTDTEGGQYEMPIPTKEGYQFKGWYFYPDGSGKEVFDTSKVVYNVDHELYAQWEPNLYTVNFNLNGGTGTVRPIEVGYGRKYGWLPTGKEVTKEGYYLEGWQTNDGVTITGDSIVAIAANHILYAKWTFLDEENKTVMLNDFNSSFSSNPAWSQINSGKKRTSDPAAGVTSQTSIKKDGRSRALRGILYNSRNDSEFYPWLKIKNTAFGGNSNINFGNLRFLIFDMYLVSGGSNGSNYDVIIFTVWLCSGEERLGACGSYIIRQNTWAEIRVDLLRAEIANISQADSIIIEFENEPQNASINYNSRITFCLNDLRVLTK